MKRRLWIYLGISIVVGLFLAIGTVTFVQAQASAGDSIQNIQDTETISVGLIPSEAGIDDMGFNWLSYQGLVRAEDDLGVTGTVYTPTSETDYAPLLQQCVDDGNHLCIAIGWQFSTAIQDVAIANPDTKFGIVDASYEVYPENLRGMLFASDQAGYLAGTLAGLMSDSNVIGTIGGLDIPPVNLFMDSYIAGAHCSNPDVSVVVGYAGDFGDSDLGEHIAQEMIAMGADVIFPVAGETGIGALLTTTQSGAWGIGVDVDQWFTVFDEGNVAGADKMLSSAMKRMDNAVFDTISDVISGTLTSGTVIYDLAVEGVSLAPYHDADVPSNVQNYVFSAEQRILNGTIDIYGSCGSEVYLPLVSK